MMSFRFLRLAHAATLFLLSFVSSSCHGYATPELNRRAMAGLWRLVTTNPKSLIATPRKEFTTYPKKHKELLLVLKEDGSFTTQHQEDASWMKGTWDYVDGQLILATDRAAPATIRDTILVGKVVATLHDTPAVWNKEEDVVYKKNATSSSTTTDTTFLSVPQGSVKVGKFMYPKHHPSFFEQPIYSPVPTGSFELRQVLGSFNAISQQEKEEFLEQFQRSDFYDKRFFLTSHPIEHKPKGRLRWSIKYNKFVEDTPRKQSAQADENSQQIPIRVMEVAFHTNNTFSTVAGLGDETILRGKWDIIGNTRNQLWMQVWRFGFGRSVSGSVYSEGKGLSDADEKTYWGEISYIEDENEEEHENSSSDSTRSDTPSSSDDGDNDDTNKRLQVKGSVFYGWGLEPQPVAGFLMKESVNEEEVDNEEEEEEDTREEDLERTFHKETDSDDDIDWSNAFQ